MEKIIDYRDYRLNKKEMLRFALVGYTAFAILAYLFYKSIIVSLILGFAFVFLERYYREYKGSKLREKLIVQFKDLLYCISGSVAAGRYMNEALLEGEDVLKSIYGEKSLLAVELGNINKSIVKNRADAEEALSDLAKRSGLDDIRNFVEVYSICKETGGDMQKVVTDTAGMIAEKMQMKKEIKTLMAQKQFEARIVSVMPVAIILFLNLISPDYLQPLYESIQGRLIMSIALLGFLLSGIWMFKLTEVEVK